MTSLLPRSSPTREGGAINSPVRSGGSCNPMLAWSMAILRRVREGTDPALRGREAGAEDHGPGGPA